jgi:hypothetical protein
MGFKSRQLPVIEVRRAMQGKDCLYFEVKKKKSDSKSSRLSNKYQE